jgi:hypothetical protein
VRRDDVGRGQTIRIVVGLETLAAAGRREFFR